MYKGNRNAACYVPYPTFSIQLNKLKLVLVDCHYDIEYVAKLGEICWCGCFVIIKKFEFQLNGKQWMHILKIKLYET